MRDVFQPCIYILASYLNGTLYVGVTSNLVQRMWQHRNGIMKGFATRYRTHRLVHFELFDTMHEAIFREKQLKRWHRQWKINLIEAGEAEVTPDQVEMPLEHRGADQHARHVGSRCRVEVFDGAVIAERELAHSLAEMVMATPPYRGSHHLPPAVA